MADDLNPSLTPSSLGVSRLFGQGAAASALWRAWRQRPRWVLASVALGAGCLLWLGWPRAQPAPAVALATQRSELPALPAPELPATPPAPHVQLADGATAELHGATSRLVPEELAEDRVRLQLSGGARFDVAPDRAPGFVVSNAQVLVRVLRGSVFSVDPEDARTRVAVEHGRIQIMWWSGATILRAGESAVFPPENESAFGRRVSEREEPPAQPKKHASKRKKARAGRSKAVARSTPKIAR